MVCSRVRELQEALSAGTIALEISNRNARVQALQDRWDKMRRVIQERAQSPEYAAVPGGATGLLCLDYKGKEATTPVYKVDTGLLAELRGCAASTGFPGLKAAVLITRYTMKYVAINNARRDEFARRLDDWQ